MNYTSLNKIKEFNPCKKGWEKLLNGLGKTDADDEPLSYLKILEINGIDDAVWSLRTNRKLAQDYAIACAEAVLSIFEKHRQGDTRVREYIEAVKGYVSGVVSVSELKIKSDAAYAAAYAAYAAYAAAYAAADAYAAAAYAAYAAAYAATAAATAAADAAAYAADCFVGNFSKEKMFISIVGD